VLLWLKSRITNSADRCAPADFFVIPNEMLQINSSQRRKTAMKTKSGLARKLLSIAVATTLILGIYSYAAAHCDTLDGPVIQDARKALEAKDVTPVLKWVKQKDEKAVRAAFAKALSSKGKKNADAAGDQFFSTLVKIHRAGEGASFTGLKPAGTVEPAVVEADKALANGSSDVLVKLVTDAVGIGIRERYERAVAAYKHKDESVAAGREFVEAYIDFTHYVERLHQDATATGGHGEHHNDPASAKHEHGH
jgi:hypothetical protein